MIPERRNMPGSRRRRRGERGGNCDLPRRAKRVVSKRASLPIRSASFHNLPTFLCTDLNPFRAGEALVLHASSPRQERWQQLKETNPLLRKVSALHDAYQESENPVVSSLRSVTSTVASWFDENETARVLRSMKILDPSFSMESFERELREYIVPEVVDAYLSADNEALKSWCSEAVRPPNRLTNHETRRRPLTCFPFFSDLQCTLGNDGTVSETRARARFKSA